MPMTIIRLAMLMLLGAALCGGTAACSTVEGFGQDISAAGRAGKRLLE